MVGSEAKLSPYKNIQRTLQKLPIGVYKDGTEYLHFSERQTKTGSGTDPHNVWTIKPKAFATPDLPRERDPVVVFKIYSEKRPESMNKPDAPFYLGVNHTTKNSDKSWFKANAMGVNKLNSLMKTMAEKAGLDNSHLTNYSAQEQQKSMSRILSGWTSMVQTETHSSKQQKKKVQRWQQQGYSRGMCFTKENFTINISSSLFPTEAQKQQTHKRIKRIFDDDSPPLT